MNSKAIKERYSVRTYDEPVSDSVASSIGELVSGDGREFLVKKADIEPYLTGLLFNYGRIKGESHYLIFAGKNSTDDDLYLGKRVEELVLASKAMGVDSCIIGGMFKGDKLSKFLGLSDSKSVKIIVSLGVKRDPKINRRRKPLETMVFDKYYGKDSTNLLFNNPDIKEILELARIAPSAVNLAPWSFVVDDDYKRVVIIKEPRLYERFAYVDLGIVACHIEIGFNELKSGGELYFGDKIKELEQKYGVDGKRKIVGYYRYNL